jgi:hypothetical protein
VDVFSSCLSIRRAEFPISSYGFSRAFFGAVVRVRDRRRLGGGSAAEFGLGEFAQLGACPGET